MDGWEILCYFRLLLWDFFEQEGREETEGLPRWPFAFSAHFLKGIWKIDSWEILCYFRLLLWDFSGIFYRR
jgi:hypothetical protein